jgi:NAD+ kinase
MKVALFGKRFGPDFNPHFNNILAQLQKANCGVAVYKPFADFLTSELAVNLNGIQQFRTTDELAHCDLVLSIGGDGTFLEAVTLVRHLDIPIAGINSGRLGFLAHIAKDSIDQVFEQLMACNFKTQPIDLLEIIIPGQPFGELNFALNEIAITKRDNASMITVHAWLNGAFLNSYWADGLIIATATGSTAYSLSVGGPIVHPFSQSFVVSPIAPHNLTVRPLVIPNNFEITLKINARGGKFMASLDSRSVTLDEGVDIVVRKAPFTVKVVDLDNHNFYNTLREKLMWGADKRN